MTKARDLADLISAGNPLADGAINVSEISDLTATAAEINKLDGLTATTAELNNVVGSTSSLQNQVDNITVTAGSLTKTFAQNESANITLSSANTTAPLVGVIKEVPQSGVSEKGNWDVNSTASNYDIHNTAYNTTLTPSAGVLTLGTGSFATEDVGKRIRGNGGDVILTSTSGAYVTGTYGSEFNNSNAIAAGSWTMEGLKSSGDSTGISLFDGSYSAYVYGSTFRVASYSQSYDFSGTDVDPIGLGMAADGSHWYHCKQGSSGYITVFSMTTNFDVTTSQRQQTWTDSRWSGKSNFDVEFNNDGSRVYVCYLDGTTEKVGVWSCNTNWRPDAGVTFIAEYNLTGNETTNLTNAAAIQFANNGLAFYYMPHGSKSGNSTESLADRVGYSYYSSLNNSGVIYYFTLSTAYDLSTATYVGYKRVPHISYASFGITQDGKWLVQGAYNDPNVFYYPIPTAFDITSIYAANEVYVNYSNYSTAGTPSQGQIGSAFVGDNYYVVSYNVRRIVKLPWGPTISGPTTTKLASQGTYHIAITNASGQINTSSWLDINSMTADQILGDGTAFYAVSNDSKTTWSVGQTNIGIRPIARNNGGTWQYNNNSTYLSTTWVNATENDEFYALKEALGAQSVNRMDKSQLDSIVDANHFTLGSTLDLMIALRIDNTSFATLPSSDGVSINYDGETLNQVADLGTDYEVEFPNSTTVKVTSLAAQNLKIRVV